MPTVSLSSDLVSVCCSTLTRSSMCLGTRLLYGGLWKNFTHFLRVCSQLLVSGSHLPCALPQSTETFGRISSICHAKSGLRTPCIAHMEIWNYFNEQYLAVTACVSPRGFWTNFTSFNRVGCPCFPEQFALENLDITSTCSRMAVGEVFGCFSRSSRSSGVERQFLEPSMVKSSSPSRAPLPISLRVVSTST